MRPAKPDTPYETGETRNTPKETDSYPGFLKQLGPIKS